MSHDETCGASMSREHRLNSLLTRHDDLSIALPVWQELLSVLATLGIVTMHLVEQVGSVSLASKCPSVPNLASHRMSWPASSHLPFTSLPCLASVASLTSHAHLTWPSHAFSRLPTPSRAFSSLLTWPYRGGCRLRRGSTPSETQSWYRCGTAHRTPPRLALTCAACWPRRRAASVYSASREGSRRSLAPSTR